MSRDTVEARPSQAGKSAFDWDTYKNRKTALQYLKRNCTLVDTIIETEDGSSYEPVHSQVISAFGDKITHYIEHNGTYLTTATAIATMIRNPDAFSRYGRPTRLKLIRLPRVNRYTLGILIECAYTGYIRTDLASGGIWQVLEVANFYEMNEVIRACCTFLIKNLNSSNCIHFYHIGIKHRHPLQRCAWHKIRANFKHILAQNLLRSSQDLLENGILGPSLMQPTASSNDDTNDFTNHQQVVTAPSGPSTSSSTTTTTSSSSSMSLSLMLQSREELEQRQNNLATIKYEHFEPLLMHDKLNIDNEESVWYAIKLWCNYNLLERSSKVANLLPCMRFPRFRSGIEFSARHIWRDPLVINDKQAQHQLAILDRNHRDFLASPSHYYNSTSGLTRDGFNLPCACSPRQLRPRVPHSILLAIGGWQQGQPTTLIESYDVNCNLWFECKPRIMAPLAYHGIEYINGVLYICGGTDGSEILNEMFTFDPVRGDCAQKASMQESRCYVSTACLNGYLFAIGGHNGNQRMKSVEKFHLLDERWQPVHDMNVARSDASACVYNSLIYIAGGLNDQAIESSVEFYDARDDSWTFITSMLTQRTSFTLLACQGSLLAIGGNNGSERLNTVEQYNFSTKLWSPHSQMRHRRSTFSAALVDETKLVVVGGYNGQTPFSQVEMYDCSTHSWTMLNKIRYDRSGLKVVVVNDLPNATDYTFLGSQGNSYISTDDQLVGPIGQLGPPPATSVSSEPNNQQSSASLSGSRANGSAQVARQQPVAAPGLPTTSSGQTTSSFAARARRTGQIFLRQIGASRSAPPEDPTSSSSSSRSPSRSNRANQRDDQPASRRSG